MRGCKPGATRQLQVLLVERRWRGASQRTDCGLAGYDLCQPESELTLRLSLDIRQCRLHQFRSDTKHFIERYEVVCFQDLQALPHSWRVSLFQVVLS